MRMIVMTMNDFPHAVMKEGTTDEEARALCLRLTSEVNKELDKYCEPHRRAYFSHYTVDVLDKNGER